MHSKIKQLFAISCALVLLFFNGHAFYFLFRCQAHGHGLHRPFVDKNSRNSHRVSAVFIKNERNSPGFSTVFLKNERNTPGSRLFFSKTNETPPVLNRFS